MGLLSGMLFGILVGIGLIAAWNHFVLRRSRHRILKATNINLLGKMSQDEVKKLLSDNFPPWISFPEFERVKWLNRQLEKIWPSVAEAAAEVIRQSVEPVLEEYRSVGISALKFDKLFLGHIPPQIEGIRIQRLKPGQIVMDMDFRWNGDASIILGIKTLVGASLPVQLKNLKFFATVRVIFKLCEDMPCISAVVVALLSKPKPEVKYNLKVIGGNLGAVPGLADMIKDTVEGAIADQLEWPHRIIVPIGGQPVDLSDLELKLQGRLTVTIVRATALKNMEMIGKSDPYVVLFIRVLFKFKTKVIDNNLNPEWNETFELNVEDLETQRLVLQVHDEDIGEDKLLGIVSYPLQKLNPEEEKELAIGLLPSLDTQNVRDTKDRGSITIKLKYHPYTKEEQEEAMQKEKEFIEAKHKAEAEGMIGAVGDAVGGAVGGAVGAVGAIGGGVGKGLGKAVKFVTFGGGSRRVKTPANENGLVRTGVIPLSKWVSYWRGKKRA